MLDCSAQWILEVAEGIKVSRVSDTALEPEENKGKLLVAADEKKTPLVLETSMVEHRGVLKPADSGQGHEELLIRISPGIELTSEKGNQIRLNSGTLEKNIITYKVPEPGETMFILAPIPPRNLAGTIDSTNLEVFVPAPQQALATQTSEKASDATTAFLDCSEQWRIEVEAGSGIELRKLRRGAFPSEDRGEILSAKVRNPSGSAAGKRLVLLTDRVNHVATINGSNVNGPNEWLLRIAEGIGVRKDFPGDKGARLTTTPPRDIVDSPLEAPFEIAFVHSKVPKKPRPLNEADMEEI